MRAGDGRTHASPIILHAFPFLGPEVYRWYQPGATTRTPFERRESSALIRGGDARRCRRPRIGWQKQNYHGPAVGLMGRGSGGGFLSRSQNEDFPAPCIITARHRSSRGHLETGRPTGRKAVVENRQKFTRQVPRKTCWRAHACMHASAANSANLRTFGDSRKHSSCLLVVFFVPSIVVVVHLCRPSSKIAAFVTSNLCRRANPKRKRSPRCPIARD